MLFYPKATTNQHYLDLLTQADKCKVTKVESLPADPETIENEYDLILDAIFGFSFQASGDIREPFGSSIDLLVRSGLPVVSVDIPSGWHVEQGYQGRGF